jgi:hypothetical protein
VSGEIPRRKTEKLPNRYPERQKRFQCFFSRLGNHLRWQTDKLLSKRDNKPEDKTGSETDIRRDTSRVQTGKPEARVCRKCVGAPFPTTHIKGTVSLHFDPIKLEPIYSGPERLARIFSDEFAFTIPAYQRPYAWEHEQAKALLADVLDAMKEAREEKEPVTYFLGSIVLNRQSDSPDATVVDGKQLLTTLTILLSVLRDLSADPARWKRHKYICEEGDADKGTT